MYSEYYNQDPLESGLSDRQFEYWEQDPLDIDFTNDALDITEQASKLKIKLADDCLQLLPSCELVEIILTLSEGNLVQEAINDLNAVAASLIAGSIDAYGMHDALSYMDPHAFSEKEVPAESREEVKEHAYTLKLMIANLERTYKQDMRAWEFVEPKPTYITEQEDIIDKAITYLRIIRGYMVAIEHGAYKD